MSERIAPRAIAEHVVHRFVVVNGAEIGAWLRADLIARIVAAIEADRADDEREMLRLAALLRGRDQFIVDRDLWSDFTDTLRRADQPAENEGAQP